MLPYIRVQILELAYESLLVVLLLHTEADPSPIPARSRKHQFSVLNWLRNVIKLTFLSQLSTLKPVFSMLLSFARGSGWDQLLCVMTKLPASFC